ncbi:MAG: hypothetical protein JWO62_2522 [Acidimicrobiaceae bacterium]|nr:hypothetical protein [Acidimicrobiaceae bacterium]
MPALTELASGIDALYMSGRGDVSEALLVDLKAARAAAEEANEAVPFDLGGVEVRVEPRSFGRYPYRLLTDHGLVGITSSAALPAIRVQPKSEHLHAVGPAASAAWFTDLAAGFTRQLRMTASRLDVFSDWQGFELEVENRTHFVGRAKRLDTHEEDGRLTGFEFGRRSTKTVAGRIYDKSLDVANTGKLWWHDKWGSAYDPRRQVFRVEFEFGRKGLTQYRVDTAQDALDRAADLYLTASTEWLSQRTPISDATRSRWPVSESWQRVQRPSFAASAIGLERVAEGKGTGALRRLLPYVMGYLASYGAATGAGSLDDLLRTLPGHARDYELISGMSFQDRLDRAHRRLRSA